MRHSRLLVQKEKLPMIHVISNISKFINTPKTL